MPVIKSAIKKLRRDKKVERENDAFRAKMEQTLRTARKTHLKKDVSLAFSILDKAVKKSIIHKNKAARLKSNLTSVGTKKTTTQEPAPVKQVKTTPKETKKPAVAAKTKTSKKK